jgi:fumarylacetoacetase
VSTFGKVSTLNRFMSYPREVWVAVRERLIELFRCDNAEIRDNPTLRALALCPLTEVAMHLPCTIGDYTDFYSSRNHATNVGIMIRGKDNALQANWMHLPVGYHGRSSTIFPSGTDVQRPCGQLQKDKADPNLGSVFGPTNLLDFELEMAFFIGGPTTTTSKPLTISEAQNRIFGYVLMNDWSARDIQRWFVHIFPILTIFLFSFFWNYLLICLPLC